MPVNRNRIPDTEEFNNVVKFYNKVWGLKSDDAFDQALEDYNRGPNSPIFKARAEHAAKWVADQEAMAKRKEDEDFYQKYAQEAKWVANGQYQNPPPAYLPLQEGAKLPGPYPESVMADPRYIDPEAFMAQQRLNQRRGALDAIPSASPPLPSWANESAPMPISPAPIKAAAPTPEHLEDANLSSWQSLANILGFQIKRR